MLPDRLADVVVTVLLTSIVAIPLVSLAVVGWRVAGVRGAACLLVGLGGLPMVLFGVFYLVGLAIVPVVVIISAGLARLRNPVAEHAITALTSVGVTAVFASALTGSDVSRGGTLLGFLLATSTVCAFAAASKIGRLFGHGVLR